MYYRIKEIRTHSFFIVVSMLMPESALFYFRQTKYFATRKSMYKNPLCKKQHRKKVLKKVYGRKNVTFNIFFSCMGIQWWKRVAGMKNENARNIVASTSNIARLSLSHGIMSLFALFRSQSICSVFFRFSFVYAIYLAIFVCYSKMTKFFWCLRNEYRFASNMHCGLLSVWNKRVFLRDSVELAATIYLLYHCLSGLMGSTLKGLINEFPPKYFLSNQVETNSIMTPKW